MLTGCLRTMKSCHINKIKGASANALKICTPNYNRFMSFLDLHLINNRALPSQIISYKHALTLHRLISNKIPTFEWLALHFNLIIQWYSYKVGQNIVINRLSIINGKIPLNWLNKSYMSFKLLCKKEFL